MRFIAVTVFVCALAGVATAQIFDDFNRANGALGANWTMVQGDQVIDNNRARGNSTSFAESTWVGTANPYQYFDVIGQMDIFAASNGSLNYAGIRLAKGTDEIMIKFQDQAAPMGQFDNVGFYHGTTPGSYGSWPGGAGFSALATPFSQGHLKFYFQPGNHDTIYVDVDTDFNGQPDFTLSSAGVNNIAGGLGFGVGMATYGQAMIDNFSITPEPAALGLLALGLLLRRR